jgi:hypothetical protein
MSRANGFKISIEPKKPSFMTRKKRDFSWIGILLGVVFLSGGVDRTDDLRAPTKQRELIEKIDTIPLTGASLRRFLAPPKAAGDNQGD